MEDLEEAAIHRGWSLFPIGFSESESTKALTYAPDEQLPVGFRLRLGGPDRAEEPEPETPVGLENPPRADWESIAAATGGMAAVDLDSLKQLLAALPHRLDITFERSSLPATSLTLTTRQIPLSAPRADFTEPPRSLAQLAVRRVLQGEFDDDEIEVLSRIEFDPQQVGRSAAKLELLIPPESPPPWRITVGIHRQDGEVVFRHEEKTSAELLNDPDRGQYYAYNAELILPTGTDAAAVYLERQRGNRLDTGRLRRCNERPRGQ